MDYLELRVSPGAFMIATDHFNQRRYRVSLLEALISIPNPFYILCSPNDLHHALKENPNFTELEMVIGNTKIKPNMYFNLSTGRECVAGFQNGQSRLITDIYSENTELIMFIQAYYCDPNKLFYQPDIIEP